MNVQHSRTGKHGHTKANLIGIDLINSTKHEWVGPAHMLLTLFEPIKSFYQIMFINENQIECLDEYLETQVLNFDSKLELESHIVNLINEDKTVTIEVLFAPVEKTNSLDTEYKISSYKTS